MQFRMCFDHMFWRRFLKTPAGAKMLVLVAIFTIYANFHSTKGGTAIYKQNVCVNVDYIDYFERFI